MVGNVLMISKQWVLIPYVIPPQTMKSTHFIIYSVSENHVQVKFYADVQINNSKRNYAKSGNPCAS